MGIKPNASTVRVNLSLNRDTRKRLAKAAIDANSTSSELLEAAVREYLDKSQSVKQRDGLVRRTNQ